MRQTVSSWRCASAFVLGAALPWLADALGTALVEAQANLPLPPVLVSWAALIVAAATALGALAREQVVAVAAAAGLGGLSAMALVILLHQLPLKWVLELWPHALALGVVLPLVTIGSARLWRRRDQ